MTPEESAKVADRIAGYRYDPFGFVMYAFDWGHGDLARFKGPDAWQAEELRKLGEDLKRADTEGGSIRISIASGHSIGKTCWFAWVILFFMSTQPDVQIIVTANTKTQLETKTWRELAKWHARAINKDWFQRTATKLYHVEGPDTWFASAVPWSDENPEAFAGAGDIGTRTVILFDEASAIADSIHETSEGAMLRSGAIKIAFGNPTRNTGWFRETFRDLQGWRNKQIDSRDCAIPDKGEIQGWIDAYGIDSDFVRVRVLGQFPRAATNQFIPEDLVDAAMGFELKEDDVSHAPRVLGIDVARFGDDRTIMLYRQGAKLLEYETYRGIDTMQTGNRAMQIIRDWRPHVVYVDAVGIGAGVCDYMRHAGFPVIEVIGSARPADANTYTNLRGECWGEMKKWLKTADLPHDKELKRDLCGLEYGFNAKMQLMLEKKEDMKKRGLDSPDIADALALTFASPAEVSDFYEDFMDDDMADSDEGRNAVTGY